MLNEKGIVDKLYDQKGIFEHHMRRKEYLEAALCVDDAQKIAMLIGLEEDKRAELFGDRQPDEPVKGLIDEQQYLKACDWCTFRGGYGFSRHTYKNVMRLRRKR